MNKTIIGLSTIPQRFNTLDTILNNLSNFNVPIYLYIPFFYKRFNVEPNINSVEKIVNKYNNINIVRGIDYGPISKLFVLLLQKNDPDTNLIICDDDCNYSGEWANQLVKQIENNPSCAFAYRGRNFVNGLDYSKTKLVESIRTQTLTPIDIITAVRGCIFKQKFFNESYIDQWLIAEKEYPFVFFNDDIWISSNLKKIGIDRYVFPSKSFYSHAQNYAAALCYTRPQGINTNKHIQYFKDVWQNSYAK